MLDMENKQDNNGAFDLPEVEFSELDESDLAAAPDIVREHEPAEETETPGSESSGAHDPITTYLRKSALFHSSRESARWS